MVRAGLFGYRGLGLFERITNIGIAAATPPPTPPTFCPIEAAASSDGHEHLPAIAGPDAVAVDPAHDVEQEVEQPSEEGEAFIAHSAEEECLAAEVEARAEQELAAQRAEEERLAVDAAVRAQEELAAQRAREERLAAEAAARAEEMLAAQSTKEKRLAAEAAASAQEELATQRAKEERLAAEAAATAEQELAAQIAQEERLSAEAAARAEEVLAAQRAKEKRLAADAAVRAEQELVAQRAWEESLAADAAVRAQEELAAQRAKEERLAAEAAARAEEELAAQRAKEERLAAEAAVKAQQELAAQIAKEELLAAEAAARADEELAVQRAKEKSLAADAAVRAEEVLAARRAEEENLTAETARAEEEALAAQKVEEERLVTEAAARAEEESLADQRAEEDHLAAEAMQRAEEEACAAQTVEEEGLAAEAALSAEEGALVAQMVEEVRLAAKASIRAEEAQDAQNAEEEHLAAEAAARAEEVGWAMRKAEKERLIAEAVKRDEKRRQAVKRAFMAQTAEAVKRTEERLADQVAMEAASAIERARAERLVAEAVERAKEEALAVAEEALAAQRIEEESLEAEAAKREDQKALERVQAEATRRAENEALAAQKLHKYVAAEAGKSVKEPAPNAEEGCLQELRRRNFWKTALVAQQAGAERLAVEAVKRAEEELAAQVDQQERLEAEAARTSMDEALATRKIQEEIAEQAADAISEDSNINKVADTIVQKAWTEKTDALAEPLGTDLQLCVQHQGIVEKCALLTAVEDDEELATKASSADEAKSSVASDDGADATEDSGDERAKGQLLPALSPFYIRDVNGRAWPEGAVSSDHRSRSSGRSTPEIAYIGDVNCKVRQEVAAYENEQVAICLPESEPGIILSECAAQQSPTTESQPVAFDEEVRWTSAARVVWPAAAASPAGTRFFLCVGLGEEEVQHELKPFQKGFFPNLCYGQLAPAAEGSSFRVPCGLATEARTACRKPLSALLRGVDGREVRFTEMDIGGLIDDIFKHNGPLGCHLDARLDPNSSDEGVSISLGAPTAVEVDLLLYSEPQGEAYEQLPMSRRQGPEDDGVWHIWGPRNWSGRFYSFRVLAHQPSTGKLESSEVPDPFSFARPLGELRSLILSEAPLLAAGRCRGRAQPVPSFVHRAHAVICGLGSSEMNSEVDLQLCHLAEAGVTHIYGPRTEGCTARHMVDLSAALNAKGLRVVVDVPLSCSSASSILKKIVPGYSASTDCRMVESLVVSNMLHLAKHHHVDGFFFEDGQLTLRCRQHCRAALNALTLESHGVDGARLLLLGREPNNGCMETKTNGFPSVSQFAPQTYRLPVIGVGCLSSQTCDALASVLSLCWEDCEMEPGQPASATASELLRSTLSSSAFAPDEAVNCSRMPREMIPSDCTSGERLRIALLGVAATVLSHGVPFLGNDNDVPISLRSQLRENVCGWLRMRASTLLLNLTDAKDVLDKVDFLECSVPGVAAIQTRNGPPARFTFAPPLCDRFARVIVVLSARRRTARLPWSSAAVQLHPLQAASADEQTRSPFFDADALELVMPPLSAAVFVEPL